MTRQCEKSRTRLVPTLEALLRTSHKSLFDLEVTVDSELGSAVSNTLTPPWRWICSIEIRFPEKVSFFPEDSPADTAFGTGTLITPRHVLTSAHLLHQFKYHQKRPIYVVNPKQIEVAPGRDDDRVVPRPFGRYKHKRYEVSAKFKQLARPGQQPPPYSSAPYDYAIIELDQKIGTKTYHRLNNNPLGWWGRARQSFIRPVTTAFRGELNKRKINIAGYPWMGAEWKLSTGTPAGKVRKNFRPVKNVFVKIGGKTVALFTYDAFREYAYLPRNGGGVSGGPVWLVDNCNRRYLVGIHRGRSPSGDPQGVLITDDMINELVKWNVSRNLLSLSQYSGKLGECG